MLNKLNTTLTQLSSQGVIGLIETKWMGTAVDVTNVALTTGAKADASAATTEGANNDSSDASTGATTAATTATTTTA